jgi:hypothetical protein
MAHPLFRFNNIIYKNILRIRWLVEGQSGGKEEYNQEITN